MKKQEHIQDKYGQCIEALCPVCKEQKEHKERVRDLFKKTFPDELRNE